MEEHYKQKLHSLLIGLEARDITEMMEWTPEELRTFGQVIAEAGKNETNTDI
jgi:hypothetical protein